MGALRWGIFGAGRISHDFLVASTALPKDEHQFVAVAARDMESAKEFAKTHSIPRVYGSYEELAKDPGIDVVYIGSVNTQHLSLAKLCLENGKNVLCEKPLAVNVKETKEMHAFAKSKNLFLMEAIWSRCFPLYQELRKRIENGSLGDILQVTVTFGKFCSEAGRLNFKNRGEGCMLLLGVYCVQFAELVFGEKPLKVITGGHLTASGADESSSTTLIFSKGRTATLINHSGINLINEAYIFGTKQTLKVRAPFWCPEELEEVGGEVYKFPLPEPKMRLNFPNSMGLHYQCNEVRKCILEGSLESELMSHESTLRIAEIMESVRKQLGVVYPQDD